MGYSRRQRFGDGRSGLHRVDFAREFEIALRSRAADRQAEPEETRAAERQKTARGPQRRDAPPL